jgi:hypothetical protein
MYLCITKQDSATKIRHQYTLSTKWKLYYKIQNSIKRIEGGGVTTCYELFRRNSFSEDSCYQMLYRPSIGMVSWEN